MPLDWMKKLLAFSPHTQMLSIFLKGLSNFEVLVGRKGEIFPGQRWGDVGILLKEEQH